MQNFNYHQHTYRCKHADFNMEDEEYVQEYLKMGFKKIAFTDHCPQKSRIDKRTNMRMEYEKRGEYLESIRKLKEKYKEQIKIESGYEIEYLPGEEENLFELKEETDKLILGQHFVYDENKALKIFGHANFSDEDLLRYGEYLQYAMKLGLPDIIAHPDIYMSARRTFGKTEEKVANIICSAAEKCNIPLEINLNNIFARTYFDYANKVLKPYKPIEEYYDDISRPSYPSKEFWKIASNYNVNVLYGIDSHFRGQILLFKELVELANRKIGKETIEKLNFIEDGIETSKKIKSEEER